MIGEQAARQRDHAYSSFLEKLLAPALAPGQAVSQHEVVGLTGMSMAATRDLIPQLEADGLFTTVLKRGLQVLCIDLNLVRNGFQLRRIPEAEATSEFCKAAPDAGNGQLAQDHGEMRTFATAGVNPGAMQVHIDSAKRRALGM